jgi:hypothetical protein
MPRGRNSWAFRVLVADARRQSALHLFVQAYRTEEFNLRSTLLASKADDVELAIAAGYLLWDNFLNLACLYDSDRMGERLERGWVAFRHGAVQLHEGAIRCFLKSLFYVPDCGGGATGCDGASHHHYGRQKECQNFLHSTPA